MKPALTALLMTLATPATAQVADVPEERCAAGVGITDRIGIPFKATLTALPGPVRPCTEQDVLVTTTILDLAGKIVVAHVESGASTPAPAPVPNRYPVVTLAF